MPRMASGKYPTGEVAEIFLNTHWPLQMGCTKTNTEKTVGMVCQPCHTLGGMLEEAYAHQATGQGPTFQ